MSLNKSIVIDNGSCMCKVGFAGETSPTDSFPSIVGKRRNKLSSNPTYVGYRATSHRGESLCLHYPVDKRVITNWEDMELVWNHAFYNELRVVPEEHQVMLTEQQNPKENREKTTQIMFEGYKVPAMYLANQAVLSLYASGGVTGIVLDSGYHITQSVPVFEGHALQHATCRLDWAGDDLVDHLMILLKERGYNLQYSFEREYVKDMKERYCYVALDFEEEMKQYKINSSIVDYEWPDGTLLAIGNELFRCPELLFQPNLVGIEDKGVHEIIFDSIRNCDIDIRKDLYSNVILSGGTTMFKGMSERIHKELTLAAPSSMKIRVDGPTKGCETVWIGGSILASLSSFQSLWITKDEYKEVGSGIVQRKCF